MTGSVVQIRTSHTAQLLTKKQLAAHLGRSTRWIELRTREGMPSEPPTERFPQRRYQLAAVEAWLASGPKKAGGHEDRLSRLEQQVATLTATLERLQRSA